MRKILLLCLMLPASASSAAHDCAITKLAPRAALTPLRYIRFTAIIENRGGGEVALTGEVGLETSSTVTPGARATLVEWKNVALGSGEYEVVLVAGRCTARDRLIVSGGAGN